MTLKELIARIRVEAIEAGVPPDSRDLDNGVLVEVLLPRCMDTLAEKVAKTPDGLQALVSNVPLVVVTGSLALPDTIREEHLVTSSIVEDPSASYVPSWYEYNNDPQTGNPTDYGRFTVKNGTFYYRPVGSTLTGFSGTVNLQTVVRPRLPATINDTVVLRDSLIQQLITLTAAVTARQVPLRDIGLDYSSLEEVQVRADLN